MVDLKELRWIEALSIAVLVAFVKNHVRSNPETDNYIGYYPSRHEFLQRMDLFLDLFRAVGADIPEAFKRRDETGRFVPVREVTESARVPRAAEDIVQTLRIDDDDAARTLRHCVGEILDNVFVHARSPVNAIICAQHFPNAGRSQVGIVDTGVGFRKSFKENEAFSEVAIDDRTAMELATLPYVTSKPQSGQPYESGYGRLGVGLFIVSEVLDRVGGRLLLVSNSCAVDRRRTRKHWLEVKPWAGAIVGFLSSRRSDCKLRGSHKGGATIGQGERSFFPSPRGHIMSEEKSHIRISDRFGRHLIGREVGYEIRRALFSGGPESWPEALNFEGVDQATESCIDEIFGELVAVHGVEAVQNVLIEGATGPVLETIHYVLDLLAEPPATLDAERLVAMLVVGARKKRPAKKAQGRVKRHR